MHRVNIILLGCQLKICLKSLQNHPSRLFPPQRGGLKEIALLSQPTFENFIIVQNLLKNKSFAIYSLQL